MRGGKRDANQAEIKLALESIGCAVEDTADVGSLIPGFPDLVASGLHRKLMIPYTALIEVKTVDGKLRPGQIDFHRRHECGAIFTVRTISEALQIFGVE